MHCADGAGGNGLNDLTPDGADDHDLAGLDVAHVGRADQIERAGLGAHDDGVAETAERQRPEPVRIAHGDEPILRHQRERKGALHVRHRLDDRLVGRRRARSRVQDAESLRYRCWSGRSTPRRPSSSFSSLALTRLPLCAMAICPCAHSMRIGCALSTLLSPAVEYRTCPMAMCPRELLERLLGKRIGDVAHRLRDAHLAPSDAAIPALSCPRCWSA